MSLAIKSKNHTVPLILHRTPFIKITSWFTKSDTCSSELDQKINEWLKWDRNETTRTAMQKLVKENNKLELSKILLNRITFGTAGLRGKMSVGYSCMNDLVIIQTGQGILKYLEKCYCDLLTYNGIVVGYDGRHNSDRWAELTAAIFLRAGYPVRLFSAVIPTPFIPLAVLKYECASGIMVTASHNPKEDNGYKLYDPNGTQIIPPMDKHIQESISKNLEPCDSSWDTSILEHSGAISDPLFEVLTQYVKIINREILPQHKSINKQTGVLFTYTPMHGVGYKYMKRVFDEIGIKFIVVTEQKEPHPDFPTVKFPNPEEGKSSLDMAIKLANGCGSHVILANDPDADRFVAAEKDLNTGSWKVFTGNELGALFGWWLLYCFKLKCPKTPLNQACMISSTVSSMILNTMSKKEGFIYVETLTGFKWIGNKAIDLLADGKKVIFCFEEAIGYMCSTEVFDKDGISAACQFATMTSFLYNEKKTVASKLEEIYSYYGYHISRNSYYICKDPQIIKKIFDKIRNFSGNNTYPKGILNNKYSIVAIRDLTTGYDSSQPDKKAKLPVSPDIQMITFNFSNGLRCTLRTSGTEPKIKYYSELCADPQVKDKELIQKTLNEMVTAICEEFLQPSVHNLIPQTS